MSSKLLPVRMTSSSCDHQSQNWEQSWMKVPTYVSDAGSSQRRAVFDSS